MSNQEQELAHQHMLKEIDVSEQAFEDCSEENLLAVTGGAPEDHIPRTSGKAKVAIGLAAAMGAGGLGLGTYNTAKMDSMKRKIKGMSSGDSSASTPSAPASSAPTP